MLSKLFGTEKRRAILSLILDRDAFGVEEIARELGMSKGAVSTYFKELAEGGLLKKSGRKFRWVDLNARRELKREMNYWALRGKLLSLREDWIKALGIYGSFARGENGPNSDIDVWIVVEKENPLRIGELHEKLEALTGKKVDLMVLTVERLNRLRVQNPYLYWSIRLASLTIWGSLNEV